MAAPSQSYQANSSTIEVGLKFENSKSLRAESERAFLATGRSMIAGKGGGRQKEYYCSNRNFDKDSRTVRGCPAAVRATKQATGEWKLSFVDLKHVNCAGSTTTTSIRAVQPLVEETLRLNPNMTGKDLRKTVQTMTGAPFSERSAFRARSNVREEGEAEIAETYMYLGSYLEELERNSPGTVTCLEVRWGRWVRFLL